MVRLGVNLDHIATLRQARGTHYPDPLEAAIVSIKAGADGITLHLREDRRHIQDDDVRRLKDVLTVPMNLEMAVSEEMLQFAEMIKPEYCCLVPEKRAELTTEGGLDVVGQIDSVKKACARLAKSGIQVSLFIDPDKRQIDAAQVCEAPLIEIHTGHYANAAIDSDEHQLAFKQIKEAAEYAHKLGLTINAGHGLTIDNVQSIAAIPNMNELNIGHSIIARAIFVGLAEAIKEMKKLINQAK